MRGLKNAACMKYVCCAAAGILLFGAAEFVDHRDSLVDKGLLKRNPCGQGEAVYEFFVEGLEADGTDSAVTLEVPEQKLTAEQFHRCVPEAADLLMERILGENESLTEVRTDLALVKEISEYGITVKWQSDHPEVLNSYGTVQETGAARDPGTVQEPGAARDPGTAPEAKTSTEAGTDMETGTPVLLSAELSNGIAKETLEIPVVIYPPLETEAERFQKYMEALVLEKPEQASVELPTEFLGKPISYRRADRNGNLLLPFLGILGAACLYLREKNEAEAKRKRREDSLLEAYPDLVSGFMILTGAGYPAKAAWNKLTEDMKDSADRRSYPLVREMQVAVNQMETGVPEIRAYASFGRRCGLKCYMKFAALLESSVRTGGKNLRKLLEEEMENALKQRADLARRKGEEASSRLLLPLFGMLSVVMAMTVAPAFLMV